eukprot:g55487.t1
MSGFDYYSLEPAGQARTNFASGNFRTLVALFSVLALFLGGGWSFFSFNADTPYRNSDGSIDRHVPIQETRTDNPPSPGWRKAKKPIIHYKPLGSTNGTEVICARCDSKFSKMVQNGHVEALRQWFLLHRRDLPWRATRDPYAVWVSEVMLQQTRVNTVLPYYAAWMGKFPTVHALAAASLEDVIKTWEGLGYYSRARNLHEGAQQVVAQYAGQLPVRDLEKIKGVGSYTANAIRSFAFHEKAAAVDGNVLRVMARFCAIEGCISTTGTKKEIQQAVEHFLPDEEPWVVMEALIELGATLCGKVARCSDCPLRNSCAAYATDRVHALPLKAKKTSIETIHRTVAVITDGQRFLVERAERGKIMGDLHQFLYWETDKAGWIADHLAATIEKDLHLSVISVAPLQLVTHSFTRYRARLTPWLVLVDTLGNDAAAAYLSPTWLEMGKLPFSAGHRKILAQLTTMANSDPEASDMMTRS